MLGHPVFRTIFVLIGLGLVAMASCGALGKVADEGFDGPSSKPGAAKNRGPASLPAGKPRDLRQR
jgi:hypothetical protein